MLTSVASMGHATHDPLGVGWVIGIGVIGLVLGLLLRLARKHGGRGQ